MPEGFAGFFTFPFRIYAVADLPDIEVKFQHALARVYTPVKLRGKGSVVSPDFPTANWPQFRWSPFIGRKKKIPPPTGLTTRPSIAADTFDGFRLDYCGPNAETEIVQVANRFVAWLRRHTAQYWLGRVELANEAYMKYGFEIDSSGRATSTPAATARSYTPPKWTRRVDKSIWAHSLQEALIGDPPIYWALFNDGSLFKVESDFRQAVLLFALSLEAARDACFASFAPTRERARVGTMLGSPFDSSTDLLKHLSLHVESVHPDSRNLRAEDSRTWKWLTTLYVARHKVAHGREALGSVDGELVRLGEGHMNEIHEATFKALRWIEEISSVE